MYELLLLLSFLCYIVLTEEGQEKLPFVNDIIRDLARKALDWLRDMNRTKIKDSYDASGSVAKPEGMCFDALSLLLSLMEPRATSGNFLCGVSHTLDYEEPGQTARPENDPERKQNPTIQKELLERRIVQLLESRFSVAQPTSVAEEDDDLSFFKSLIPSFKELPLQRKLILRSKIMNCVIAEVESGKPSNRPWSPPPIVSSEPP